MNRPHNAVRIKDKLLSDHQIAVNAIKQGPVRSLTPVPSTSIERPTVPASPSRQRQRSAFASPPIQRLRPALATVDEEDIARRSSPELIAPHAATLITPVRIGQNQIPESRIIASIMRKMSIVTPQQALGPQMLKASIGSIMASPTKRRIAYDTAEATAKAKKSKANILDARFMFSYMNPRTRGERCTDRAAMRDVNATLNVTVSKKVSATIIDEDTIDAYEYVTRLPFQPAAGISLLAPQTRSTMQKTLVLDLDETLVHCSNTPITNPDFVFDCQIKNFSCTIYGCIRPNAQEFIEEMAKCFQVVVFTASLSPYADKVIDLIDPKRLVKRRLYREHCSFVNGSHIKDMQRLGRDLRDVVIVDNMIQAFGLNIRNGIHIKDWFSDKDDVELHTVSKVLNECKDAVDVRDVLDEAYGLEKKIKAWEKDAAKKAMLGEM